MNFTHDSSVTDEDDIVDLSRTNYSVLRVTRDLFSGSSIGAIAINKQDTDTYNRAGGLDFAYRPNDSIDVRGLWARTYETDVSSKNDAMYFGGTWRKQSTSI